MLITNQNLSLLFKKLKITPKNYSYYIEATTHTSFSNENNLSYNYERLEFLGDAIISQIISQYLFTKNPPIPVGEMSKIRILIVRSESEILAAKMINLQNYIKIGKSLQGNMKSHIKILEDVYEALIGAIYLDLGYETAKKVIYNTLIYDYENNILDRLTDYKSKFQELMSQYGKHKIIYKSKKLNNGQYYVELWTNNIRYGSGIATKIKLAEQIAAKIACKKFVNFSVK